MANFSLTFVFFVWIVGFGTLFMITKKRITDIFLKSKFPRLINYFIILTPIILIEEAFTIENSYFWAIIPMLIVFYIFFFILYVIQKITKLGYVKSSILCGILGWINEFILVGRINHPSMEGLVLIIMTLLSILIYGVMAILPTYYMEQSLKHKK